MYRMAIALCVAVLAAGPAAASDETDVMTVVHQWVEGINKGDMKSALAPCADEVAIIDGFSPYEWHGPGACGKWGSAYDAWVAKDGVTNATMTPGKARHVDVEGAHAYVVLPVSYAFKEHGKPMKQTGTLLTMSLAKGSSGWRIAGWSWADGITHAVSADSAH